MLPGGAGRRETASSVASVLNNGMRDRLKSVPHSVSSCSLRPSLALDHRDLSAKLRREGGSQAGDEEPGRAVDMRQREQKLGPGRVPEGRPLGAQIVHDETACV